jgi:hypothetical protein
MNRLINLRPLAGAAVLALASVGLEPAFAALPQAGSQSRVALPALPARVNGTLVALHRARRTGDLADAKGHLFSLRFTSVAQERRLHVGSRLTVSRDARDHVRLLVRALRTDGVSTRAHIRGIVARRLGRSAVEVLGVNGAAVVVHLGRARITRVHHRTGLFSPALASADEGPNIAPGDEIDTAVTLTGAGAVATGTATVAALPPASQVEVEGIVTAVDPAAGTITIQDEDGPTTVVSVSAAGTYAVGQDVEVVGTPTGPGGSAATVQAQDATREAPEAPEPPEHNTPEPPEPPHNDG